MGGLVGYLKSQWEKQHTSCTKPVYDKHTCIHFLGLLCLNPLRFLVCKIFSSVYLCTQKKKAPLSVSLLAVGDKSLLFLHASNFPTFSKSCLFTFCLWLFPYSLSPDVHIPLCAYVWFRGDDAQSIVTDMHF